MPPRSRTARSQTTTRPETENRDPIVLEANSVETIEDANTKMVRRDLSGAAEVAEAVVATTTRMKTVSTSKTLRTPTKIAQDSKTKMELSVAVVVVVAEAAEVVVATTIGKTPDPLEMTSSLQMRRLLSALRSR